MNLKRPADCTPTCPLCAAFRAGLKQGTGNRYRVTVWPAGWEPYTVEVESSVPLRQGQVETRAMGGKPCGYKLRGELVEYSIELLEGEFAPYDDGTIRY